MKNHEDLTKALLKSIDDKTKYDRDKLVVYIADTGSDKSVKQDMYNFIDNIDLDVEFIEYSYYNFAKINNDVVKNHIDSDTELLLFCNNDVELVNDAITEVTNIFNNVRNCGTVGALLLYPKEKVENANKIQHAGIQLFPIVTHFNQNKEYDKTIHNGLLETCGNTGAFLLTSIYNFNDVGGFNEDYKTCFEDVEFNIKQIQKCRPTLTCLNAICIHKESSTRKLVTDSGDKKKIVDYFLSDKTIVKKSIIITNNYKQKFDSEYLSSGNTVDAHKIFKALFGDENSKKTDEKLKSKQKENTEERRRKIKA